MHGVMLVRCVVLLCFGLLVMVFASLPRPLVRFLCQRERALFAGEGLGSGGLAGAREEGDKVEARAAEIKGDRVRGM